MTKQAHTPAADSASPSFTPVPVRARHDGWTATRQIGFIRALAATACVEEACRAVGMSPQGAYELRARPDAASFRQAWDIALDFAVSRVAEAALGRALNGVVVPIFYKGEQVGEKRVFNETLTMFILRNRAAEQYGAWRDDTRPQREDPDGAAIFLGEAIRRVAEDGAADIAGLPRPGARRSRPSGWKTTRRRSPPKNAARKPGARPSRRRNSPPSTQRPRTRRPRTTMTRRGPNWGSRRGRGPVSGPVIGPVGVRGPKHGAISSVTRSQDPQLPPSTPPPWIN